MELWTIPAAELLEAGDVGLIPWVPLTDCADPPEKVMERCRDVIEQNAPPGEKANLLAVTQVLAYLRYNDVGLLTILGGRQVMLESPLIDEIVMAKALATAQRGIRTVLEARFGDIPAELIEQIESVDQEEQLQSLTWTAAACPDLDAFRRAVARSGRDVR
ncbi:MAG: hypothetical protein EA424_29385 [Planctomycetaceae bacterium]|nr:MAG: hypothetical protein EA424_29385 [Planctomycetaceae bacterium]